eukprot:ctg_698.g352
MPGRTGAEGRHGALFRRGHTRRPAHSEFHRVSLTLYRERLSPGVSKSTQIPMACKGEGDTGQHTRSSRRFVRDGGHAHTVPETRWPRKMDSHQVSRFMNRYSRGKVSARALLPLVLHLQASPWDAFVPCPFLPLRVGERETGAYRGGHGENDTHLPPALPTRMSKVAPAPVAVCAAARRAVFAHHVWIARSQNLTAHGVCGRGATNGDYAQLCGAVAADRHPGHAIHHLRTSPHHRCRQGGRRVCGTGGAEQARRRTDVAVPGGTRRGDRLGGRRARMAPPVLLRAAGGSRGPSGAADRGAAESAPQPRTPGERHVRGVPRAGVFCGRPGGAVAVRRRSHHWSGVGYGRRRQSRRARLRGLLAAARGATTQPGRTRPHRIHCQTDGRVRQRHTVAHFGREGDRPRDQGAIRLCGARL